MSKCSKCGEPATWKYVQAETRHQKSEMTPSYTILHEDYYCKTHKPAGSQPIKDNAEQPTLFGFSQTPMVKTLTGEVIEDKKK